jgi:hypothetical protein
MKEGKAVISGSVVLPIMDPDSARPNDFDLFVPRGGMAGADTFLGLNTAYVKVDDVKVDHSDDYTNGHTGMSSEIHP